MREFWLSYKTIGIALPLLVVVAVPIGGWISPMITYILWGFAFVWLVCALIYQWKNRKRTQSKNAVGGLPFLIKGNVVNITINVKSEDIYGRGLIEKGESTEIVDSSAGAEIEKE